MTDPESGWAGTICGQPKVGALASRSRTTSMNDIEMFTQMTGDKNPIHYDTELAKASAFGAIIVQGGVTTGLLNAVVAEDLPGPGSVFLETNWKFLKAVNVGEKITATIRVIEVRKDKPICKLETTVKNSDEDECVIGSATTYTMPLTKSSTR
jgi:acyl dehydratase